MNEGQFNKSRRDFIKLSAFAGLGSLLITDPLMNLLANKMGISPEELAKSSFTCELFRQADLLSLKYFFFNARIKHNHIFRENKKYPLYIYVQLPSQHIAEELVDNYDKIMSRKDFKNSQSFLAQNSLLAFKLREGKEKITSSIEDLLNWSENFQLLTIDEFARRENDVLVDYPDTLKVLKNEFGSITSSNILTWHKNFANDEDGLVPISKFELPYKMFLSPIAEPLHVENDEKAEPFNRQYGEHEFLNTNDLRIEYVSSSKSIQIIKIWENQLVFRNLENQIFQPHFKVVKWDCQHSNDKDENINLLPAPIHREELHELTMLPEYERDVVSSKLKISAYGATANLKYKHDNPLTFSTVAWEQKLVTARDNYVSITFRAIDVFTGIKLLVSELTDRSYKYGVSFLPKLYYISYAENYKDYRDPITISKIPFVKVIPTTKGAFFTAQLVKNNGDTGDTAGVQNSYLVARAKAFTSDKLNPEKLLTFDYIGIDKAGKEHNFQSKIIFIPAEKYIIKSGEYEYKPGETIKAPNPVAIPFIGRLNPSYQEKYGSTSHTPCGEAINPPYRYEQVKSFQSSELQNLKNQLSDIKKHVDANIVHYKISITGDITFAKLDHLKANNKIENSKGVISNKSLIREDATSATFNTKEILLFAQVNTKFSNDADNFLDDNPLVATLDYADIIVSQIDQLEGQSRFRRVIYYNGYFDSNQDIDKEYLPNKVKILFEIDKSNKIGNLFSENYRRVGAVANLGVDITHISVLDQGIIYNHTHNDSTKGFFIQNQGTKLKSSSIFGAKNAEILGIPLTEIIDEFLPVEDLPVFNYLQQAEESVLKLQQLANEYKGLVEEWVTRYNTVKKELEGYLAEFKGFDEKIKQVLENGIKAWLDNLVEQSGAENYYKAVKNSLTDYKKEFDKYKEDILVQIDTSLKAKFKVDFYDEIGKFTRIQNPTQKEIEALFRLVNTTKEYKPAYFKETVKLYCINALSASIDNNERFENIIKFKDEIDKTYQDYFNAFITGYMEATVFASSFVAQLENKVAEQVTEMKQHVNTSINNVLVTALGENYIKAINKILLLYELTETYSYYAKIYKDLKEDHYSALMKELGISFPSSDLKDFEKKLTDLLITQIQYFPTGDYANIKDLIISTLKENRNCLKNYDIIYSEYFKKTIEKELQQYLFTINDSYKNYDELQVQIVEIKSKISKSKLFLQNFTQNIVQLAKAEMEKQKGILLKELKGSQEYQTAQKAITEIRGLINKVQEISKQKLDYNYSTKKFKKASIGNVIEFVPNDTELTVNVTYEIEFDIDDFDRLPKVKKQSYRTESKLSNFKIGALQLIYIDFEKVYFISGSDVKDDFQVGIRNVQFAGCLSFVQAFQEYLSTISDNLVFDINASGASIGYGFSIPDFSAGYFNFFNFNLSALLTLPFNPKEALLLRFGFGSPLNKFGITVSGIFGGQGYFTLIADPKRGIVGMEIVLEFGAIFNLNLTVAKGTAYLVGGVYIKRFNGIYQTQAYILCVGRFDILGLFSASITFYLGMIGEGPVLKGRCKVTVTKRLHRFFKISVGCTMEKTLKGGKSNETAQERFIVSKGSLRAQGLTIEDTNLNKGVFYSDEDLYITFYLKDARVPLSVFLTKSSGFAREPQQVKFYKIKDNEGLAFIRLELWKINSNSDHELIITQENTEIFRHKVVILSASNNQCENDDNKSEVSTREYYASYYTNS